MALNATAVLSMEVDSTAVLRKLKAVEDEIKKVPQKIAPVVELDTAKVKQQIEGVRKQIESFSGAKIANLFNFSTANIEKQVKESVKNLQDFEKQAKEVSRTLQNVSRSANTDFSKAGVKGFLKKFTQETKEARAKIKENLDAISQYIKNTGTNIPDLNLEKLQKNIALLTSGGSLFGKFSGRVEPSQIKQSLDAYKKILTEFADKLKDTSKTEVEIPIKIKEPQINQAEVAAKTKNKFAAVGKAIAVAASAGIAIGVGSYSGSFLIPIIEALTNSALSGQILGALSGAILGSFSGTITGMIAGLNNELNKGFQAAKIAFKKGWAGLIAGFNIFLKKSDFVKRFEWGQVAKGLVSEAEAVFSAETRSRQIFSKLFNIGGIAGQFGYSLGKLVETSAGIIKGAVSTQIIGIENALKKVPLGNVPGIFLKMARFIFEGAISIFQIAINKFTLAVAASILVAIPKGILGALSTVAQKIGSGIKSLFSFGGGGGFGGGGSSAFDELAGKLSFSALALSGGFVASVKADANLEERLLAVSTISGQFGASLSKSFRDVIAVSNEFGRSALDVSKALYDITSSGFSGSKALLVLLGSLTYAQAGMTDASVAGAAVVRTLRSFNLEASEASRVADILFNTVNRGIISPEELAREVTSVTSIAASVGLKFEEVGAVIANLTRNGQLAEQAVTGLASILKDIISPSSQAETAIRKLGIEWSEAAVRGKGFIKFFQELAPKILQNKQAFSDIVGDIRGFKSLVLLAQSVVNTPTGTGSLQEDIDSMQRRGSAMMAAARVAIGFNAQMEKFWNTFVNILRNFGEYRVKFLTPLLETANAFVDKIASLTNVNIDSFWDEIKVNINIIKQVVFSFFTQVWELAKNIFFGFVDVLKGVWKVIGEDLKNALVDGVKSALGVIGTLINPKDALAEGLKRKAEKEEAERRKITGEANIVANPDSFIQKIDAKLAEVGAQFNKIGEKAINFNPEPALVRQKSGLEALIKELQSKLVVTPVLDKLSFAPGLSGTNFNILTPEIEKTFKATIGDYKEQIKQINEQLTRLPLNEAEGKLQKLYEAKAKAERDSEFSKLPTIIKAIGLQQIEVERLKQQATNKTKVAVNSQGASIDELAARARKLLESTKDAGFGLNKLGETLDDIFGKDVERISKKYGVARDLANVRDLTKDVIEAKAAGFSQKDIDTIIQTGVLKDSELLTRIFRATDAAGIKTLNTVDVTKLGFTDEIIKFLDRVEKIGITKEGRSALFKNRITSQTFDFLDRQVAQGDKESLLIDTANNQFKDIAQQRDKQIELNRLQEELNRLTGRSVAATNQLDLQIVEIRKIIDEIKRQQALKNKVNAGGP